MSETREEHSYMVATANDFMQQARLNMTAEMQKFLCYCISKIKPTDSDFEKYTISAVDFAELAGIKKNHVYRDFRSIIEEFDKQVRWIQIGDDHIHFRVFSEAEYNEKQGSVTVMFNSRLKAYLLQLGTNYTMFELWNILGLKRKYSIRLYEIFRSYAYKRHMEFEVEELKSLLCCENYKAYKDFRTRILDPAVKEINEKTDLRVSYSTINRGKGGKVSKIIVELARKKTMEAYGAYLQTVKEINRKNGQIEGQISLFDLGIEDFEKRKEA